LTGASKHIETVTETVFWAYEAVGIVLDAHLLLLPFPGFHKRSVVSIRGVYESLAEID